MFMLCGRNFPPTRPSSPAPHFNRLDLLYLPIARSPTLLPTDGQEIARMCGVTEPLEFMPEALFEDLPDKYQVISYKEYSHMHSSVSVDAEGTHAFT